MSRGNEQKMNNEKRWSIVALAFKPVKSQLLQNILNI